MKKYLHMHTFQSSSYSIGVEAAVSGIWDAACKALDESVHEISEISKNNFCPVDTGDLKGSEKDELVVDSEDEHTREISYDTPYAVYVHEIPVSHYNPPSAQWKFLETPVRLNESKLVENIKSAVSGSLDS
jgi:hypothetical protein